METEMDKAIDEYLDSLKNQNRAADARTLLPIMEQASGYKSWLAGTMVGFGEYHYEYDSGQSGDWFVTGFAPRAQNTVVYIMPGFSEFEEELTRLGKHKLGKSCLYLGALKNVDLDVLSEMVSKSVRIMQERYECKLSPVST